MAPEGLCQQTGVEGALLLLETLQCRISIRVEGRIPTRSIIASSNTQGRAQVVLIKIWT
jgi:hypothetical protein